VYATKDLPLAKPGFVSGTLDTAATVELENPAGSNGFHGAYADDFVPPASPL
jgi:hypothetical protein